MFGTSTIRHLKSFKCCFSVQDPMVPMHLCNTHPNLMVGTFLEHVQEVSQSVWLISFVVATGEDKVGFKGHHQDKKRVTY